MPESIITLAKRAPIKCDVVLALDLFHRLLKYEASFKDLEQLLHNLHMKEMYLEYNRGDKYQTTSAFINLSPQEFVEFIIQNSLLNNNKLIEKHNEERLLYKLWSS